MESEKRVLIVDDDPVYAKLIRGWIREICQVFVVTAGKQALNFLTKKQVDLILLDYEMPELDGPSVLEYLRMDPETEDIPVVFLTGIDSGESLKRLNSLRAEGCILKSAGKEELLNYVRNFFGRT